MIKIVKVTAHRTWDNNWGGMVRIDRPNIYKRYSIKNGAFVPNSSLVKAHIKSLFPLSKKTVRVQTNKKTGSTLYYDITFKDDAEEAEFIMTFKTKMEGLELP